MMMAQLADYCQEDSMLFSDMYHDHVSGMTGEFPTPKAFRVGSYSGSDCERKFQTFPTPPDSPVLAELTPPNTQSAKQQGSQPVNGFAHARYLLNEDCSVSSSSSPATQPAEMDLTMLMEDLLHGNMTDHFSHQLCDNQYHSNVGLGGNDGLHKSDFLDNLTQFSPNSPINLSTSMFTSSFSESLDDCTIPSPSPSPITVCDIDIFAGDLPNLDDLTLVSEFAQMESAHNPRSQRGAFGMGSSGEDSDIDSVVSGYSPPIDELQQSTYHTLSSSVMSHPPPLYHEHHHNIQQYHQYRHHAHHQSQTPYPQHHSFAAASAPNGRTHNYQCRVQHTTLKMLDTHADGVVTQEMSAQQGSCAGPIRKPFRARPRKQSVTSSDDGGSDEEHVVTTTTASSGSTGSSPNRNRGRAMKGNHLWEFIRDLLKSESYCPKFIRWEDREAGVFRFVNSEAVANMWGRKKNNPQMTYEKLSRAMRYYYKREILERVDGRRLVYKFGKNAEGWKEAAGLQ
ncbi:uncharacterized protein LOC582205 isoform X2 [Strongylocentrotus purpuratus]|uniref:ETS domain-containing protein n=1 Tax=Strongylocentrotus purpuratus TaxID=7668 RepID=A0A7M7LVQ5_STRPU|nr:uncharacterized protein LOC582205 isoform X2 [Strongylocentrotus purpuratus]|eukprot:XP_011664706.1 PREDICTED: uncharacterized protein LOC582205 isoform X2 [Strongylocentrotus purpuratus]